MTQYCDGGVRYTVKPNPSFPLLFSFVMVCNFKNGKPTIEQVYVTNLQEGLALLRYWNRGRYWNYFPI